jgi:hypothetical protein
MKNIKIGEYYKIWEDLRKRRKLSTSFLQLQHIHFYIFPNITFTLYTSHAKSQRKKTFQTSPSLSIEQPQTSKN